MKSLAIATALSIGLIGAAFAQTSAPSTNPSAHSQPSTAPNEGRSMSTDQGSVKPCSQNKSGTSDREGGQGKTAASAGQTNNPGGSENGGGC